MSADLAPSGRSNEAVDLVSCPPLRLGGLDVRPATREVIAGEIRRQAEPRVLQVLVALADARGEVVSRDQLVRRCWAGRIVGEDAINRSVAKTRQLADLTDPPAFQIETIPRVGYRLRTRSATAPDAAAEPNASPPPEPQPGGWAGRPPRRALLAAAAVGAAGLAAGGGWTLWRARGGRPPPLVAVLPFDNLSPDPQLGYFADGLSEDILDKLARSGGMRVTARTSSFSFRGAAKVGAAKALGADYLLDGSVLRDGTHLRVNAHLSDAHAGETLWSDAFDREVAQGLQLEDEIAGRVAFALKARLTPGAPGLIAPEVFDLYLQGLEALRSQSADALKRGRAMMQEATRHASGFAAAWYELAVSYWRDAYVYPVAEQEGGFELGRRAARRVLELEPGNGGAIALLAQMDPFLGHWTVIDAAQRRGLRLSPNDGQLIVWHAWLLLNTGRSTDALALLDRARALDPLEVWTGSFTVRALVNLGRVREAEAALTRLCAIRGTPINGAIEHYWNLIAADQRLEAADFLDRKLADAGPYANWNRAMARALRASKGGSAQERKAAAEGCLAVGSTGMQPATEAILMLALLGEEERALEVARSVYLRRGGFVFDRTVQIPGRPFYPQHGEPYASYLFDPPLASLRRSGRLKEIFDGIGLTAFWRATAPPDP